MHQSAPEARGTVYAPRTFLREHEHVMIAAFCASREDAILRLHLGSRAADYKGVGDAQLALREVCKIEVSMARVRNHLVKLRIILPATWRDTVKSADLYIASRVEK